MTIKKALETFEDFENEDLYDLILGLSDEQPQLFIDVTYAIDHQLHLAIIEEMKAEELNGYPMYPELHQ